MSEIKINNPLDDDIINRLEKQLDEIDTDEFLQDMTTESLEKKGFIGKNRIALPKSQTHLETEKEHLVFSEGIDYERLPDKTSFSSIPIESLQHLADVEQNALIGTRSADERTSLEVGENVVKKVADNKEYFYATKKGKVVLFCKKIFVVPSDRDCEIFVKVDTDKMHAYIDCKPGWGNGQLLTEQGIVIALQKAGVKVGIDREAIARVAHDVEASKTAESNVCIASGTPAVIGADGTIEYGFSTEKKEYDFRILADGRIDYRNSANIVTVKKDQLLARIIPPQKGTAGTNLFGETISADHGQPASITAGMGVRASPDGTEYYSEINGCVIQNGSIIEVVNTYIVSNDVDYSTGNIDFNGNVIVNGNVLDGFEIKAEGDIIISKLVESAHLEAGRDIIVMGGVQGKGKGLLSAGRDIRIGYAQNARLEAQGNIAIQNFAINSYIFTSKCLTVQEKRGAIIGGEIFAQRGIDVKVLGSENGMKTMVEAGTNFLVMRKISELDDAIRFCNKNIDKIDDSLKTVSGRLKAGATLNNATKSAIAKAMEKKQALFARQKIMIAKRDDLKKESLEHETCFIKVKQICHNDVSITIREVKLVTSKPRENVCFFEDKKNNEIGIGPY